MDLIKNTFNTSLSKLPTINDITNYFDNDIMSFSNKIHLRKEYNIKSFPILTHDFIEELVVFLSKFKNVAELSCGAGWLSWWINRYGGNCRGVDNKSWKSIDYEPWVIEEDSIAFIKNNHDVDIFILSWPYMDDVAYNIFKAMKKSQYLLYIGEGIGGCTASDSFFNLVKKSLIKNNLYKSFISFKGIHDSIYLYKK